MRATASQVRKWQRSLTHSKTHLRSTPALKSTVIIIDGSVLGVAVGEIALLFSFQLGGRLANRARHNKARESFAGKRRKMLPIVRHSPLILLLLTCTIIRHAVGN